MGILICEVSERLFCWRIRKRIATYDWNVETLVVNISFLKLGTVYFLPGLVEIGGGSPKKFGSHKKWTLIFTEYIFSGIAWKYVFINDSFHQHGHFVLSLLFPYYRCLTVL